MFTFVLGTLGAVALALPVAAQVQSFPASVRTQDIQTQGASSFGAGDAGIMRSKRAGNRMLR